MDVSDVDVTAEPVQPELVSQVTPSNPIYVPLERFEDVQQENHRLKAQLESMVSLKVYQDLCPQIGVGTRQPSWIQKSRQFQIVPRHHE